MKLYLALAAVAVGLLTSSKSFAWGKIGHQVVGQIAENHLTPAAKKAVAEIIGYESLAQAANWGDEVRSDAKYEKYDPWHYVEIPDGMTYPQAPKNPGGDVIMGIQTTIDVLMNKSTKLTKKEALRYLVHFMGDVHQPMHVGNGSDQGANLCIVKYAGRNTNLHVVWDTLLVQARELSYTEFSKFLDRPDLITAAKLRTWSQGNVIDWAHESMKVRNPLYPPNNTPTASRTEVAPLEPELASLDLPGRSRNYCKKDGAETIPTPLIPPLSYFYEYKVKSTVDEQLSKAGVRLATVLNEIFK